MLNTLLPLKEIKANTEFMKQEIKKQMRRQELIRWSSSSHIGKNQFFPTIPSYKCYRISSLVGHSNQKHRGNLILENSLAEVSWNITKTTVDPFLTWYPHIAWNHIYSQIETKTKPCFCLTWHTTTFTTKTILTTSPGEHQGQGPFFAFGNQIDYILCSQRWRSSIQSAKTRPEEDCGSDHELLIAKIRLKSKKVGKTPRPLRYYLNQIPYDYTVEVRNRFKGLDLKDRVPEELWTEVHNIVQEAVIKTIPKKKKCKKAKWLPEEALQTAVKRREAKNKGKMSEFEIYSKNAFAIFSCQGRCCLKCCSLLFSH